MISTTEFFAQMTGDFASPSRNQTTFRVADGLDPLAVVAPLDAPHPASAAVIVNGVACCSTIHREILVQASKSPVHDRSPRRVHPVPTARDVNRMQTSDWLHVLLLMPKCSGDPSCILDETLQCFGPYKR